MTVVLEFRVFGIPAPQGSKRHVGGGRMVESSKKVKPWREAVSRAAQTAASMHQGFARFDGPLRVAVTFHFRRPKSHFRTGSNSHILKDGAPTRPIQLGYGDIEKLERSTYDALTQAGIWGDDKQVAVVHVSKVFSDHPGADIRISELLEIA